MTGERIAPVTTDDPPHARTAAEFRAFLAECGFTIKQFARLLRRLGDPRDKATVDRYVASLASGEFRVSGEMHVVMGVIRNSRRRAAAAARSRPALAAE